MDLGTYSMTVTEDGRGVTFSAQPSPLAIISGVIFVIFPPYLLFLFLCFHALLGNRWFLRKVDPAFDKAYTSIKKGTCVFVDNVKNMINEMNEMDDIHGDHPVDHDVQLESMTEEEDDYEEEEDEDTTGDTGDTGDAKDVKDVKDATGAKGIKGTENATEHAGHAGDATQDTDVANDNVENAKDAEDAKDTENTEDAKDAENAADENPTRNPDKSNKGEYGTSLYRLFLDD